MGVSKEAVKQKILDRIDAAIDCLLITRDVAYNETISCVVCNLANAHQCLEDERGD